MSAIQVSNLTKTFGDVAAVDGLDLTVAEGEIVGLLGPSGCGKTTTLRCVAGLEMPSSGRIDIGGNEVWNDGRNVPTERRGLGMVFQSYALWPHMTVEKNVTFALDYSDVPKQERRGLAMTALRTVGMDNYAARYPSELSGGQQQRVALARAIAARPSVLLFDEPLSNLDAKLRNRVRLELKELLTELNTTALYVTHDQREAMALCDRIAVMTDGRIRQVATPEEVYRSPIDMFVAAFVGETNLLPFDSLSRSDDGSHTMRIAGLPITVPDGCFPAEFSGGSSGYVILRPDNVRIRPSNSATNGHWHGHVLERLFSGTTSEYLVALASSDWNITVYSSQTLHQNDPCVLALDFDRAIFLPGSTVDFDATVSMSLSAQRRA